MSPSFPARDTDTLLRTFGEGRGHGVVPCPVKYLRGSRHLPPPLVLRPQGRPGVTSLLPPPPPSSPSLLCLPGSPSVSPETRLSPSELPVLLPPSPTSSSSPSFLLPLLLVPPPASHPSTAPDSILPFSASPATGHRTSGWSTGTRSCRRREFHGVSTPLPPLSLGPVFTPRPSLRGRHRYALLRWALVP